MSGKIRKIGVKLSSLKVTAFLLSAFLLLTFWGILAQANGEAQGVTAAEAAERFFNSYFVWTLGVLPVPAFKMLSVISTIHLILCLKYRMPRGFKNAGLWGMHIALLFLLLGSLVGSEVKREYNGYAVATVGQNAASFGNLGEGQSMPMESAIDLESLKFFDVMDSLGHTPVDIPLSLKSRESEGGFSLQTPWPYSIQYRGFVEMAPQKNVWIYRAVYDPFRFVPYAFMAIFVLSALFHYGVKSFEKRGKNCTSEWGAAQKSIGILPLFLFSVVLLFDAPAKASEEYSQLLPPNFHADSPVLVGDAVHSFDSFARDVLDGFSGKVTYKCRDTDACQGKLDAVAIVEKIRSNSDESKRMKLFKVLRSDVLMALKLSETERYVSYGEIQKSRGLLEVYASRNDEHPATLEMKRLLDNAKIFEGIFKGDIPGKVSLRINDVNPSRLKWEVFYHRINFALWGFILASLGCVVAAINVAFKNRKMDVLANVLGMATGAVLALMFALRFYISGRIPLASLYEVVLMVALLLEAFETVAFLFCKRRTYSLILPIAFMATILLFFAKFVLESGNTFQEIPAVLNSSVFLTLHVFTIALGFAAMILSGIVAHVALFKPTESRLRLLYGVLAFGAVFSIIGTLLGGVWADYAWGRFWGFDPKECGALFVCLWAMLSLHLRGGHLISTTGFALLNCFNIIVTFLCWFGINLLGVGLHSYGFQNGSAIWLFAFVLIDAAVITCLAWRARQAERHPLR